MAAALAPAYAIAILLAGGPDQGCPSPRQLSDALTAHLPGMVLPLGHATGPATLRLSVATDTAGAMRLDLSDPAGSPLLHRWLPESERNHVDCPALAETAALIVERYWHEVGYDVPVAAPSPPKPPPPTPAPAPPKPAPPKPTPAPPKPAPAPPKSAPRVAVAAPPAVRTTTSTKRPTALPSVPLPLPPPRWWLGAGGATRVADSGDWPAAAQLALAVERPVFGRRVGLRLSVGVETEVEASQGALRASVRQFPIRMGAYWPISLGFGQLEPGLGVDLDVISVSFVHATTSGLLLGAAPGADAALGWAFPLPNQLYVRVLTEAMISVPLLVVPASNNEAIFTTPRLAALIGIELGVWFP